MDDNKKTKQPKISKLLRNDLRPGLVVYEADNKLFYKSGIRFTPDNTYKLIQPADKDVQSFIPECKKDNDEWDENLEIVGADCDVWVMQRWWVMYKGNKTIKTIKAFLSKWSTAIKNHSNIVLEEDLEKQGYFDEII